jgi:pyruvate dehydrogenase E2 component (dihydrolipoamide acetyltransferase)
MRQIIARKLVESKQEIPHYQVSMVFAMDAMMALRADLNTELADQGVKLSVNDLLVRACAVAMHRNPLMNASWDGDAIVYHGNVNIGVAVALPEERGGGLVVPVLRNADERSLRAISAETRALAEKARTRGLSIEEMEGATFTISNLGMFGVDAFTAIINPPNSAILAVGACLKKPVVRDGELAIGWEMNATLSNDHRVVDGATAARYLGTLKELIEHPAAILV